MKILLIDNYDSFTFNLLHLIRRADGPHSRIDVVANDTVTAHAAQDYDAVVVSPGPGVPSEAGNLLSVIRELAPHKPILGVCLGHQAIAEAFGAGLYCTREPLHGVRTEITLTDKRVLFRGMPDVIEVGRYHSWLVSQSAMPGCLSVTATDRLGNIMAISHSDYRVHGVQFHPESFMTPHGAAIMRNFLNAAG